MQPFGFNSHFLVPSLSALVLTSVFFQTSMGMLSLIMGGFQSCTHALFWLMSVVHTAQVFLVRCDTDGVFICRLNLRPAALFF